MWVRVTVPGAASSSAVTFTVCAVLQSEVVKVRLVLSSERSVVVKPPMVTETSPAGSVSNTTEYSLLLPPTTVIAVGLTVTPTVSSSITVTDTLPDYRAVVGVVDGAS